MAENLCNNPKALITPRGLSREKPCGFWEAEGWGWCNRKDYNDWLAKYRIIIDSAEAQMRDLKKARKEKGSSLSEEELMAEAAVKLHKDLFASLQEEANKDEGKLSSQEYDQKIKKIITQSTEVLCLIENVIQSGIEGLDVNIKATGLIEGSRTDMGTGAKIGYAAAALVGLILYKRLKD